MKTIGIIGGLGPPSTICYYDLLTRGVNKALGGNHSARIILTSVNGEEIKALRLSGDAKAEGDFYAREAERLERAGADFILIASNTSHKNAPFIEQSVSIPLLHLADATALAVREQGITKAGLLGTALTMEEDFYKERLQRQGLDVLVPDAEQRKAVSRSIYDELTRDIVRPETNALYVEVIRELQARGAEAIILGCTELTLLDLSSVQVPLFDTVHIHVEAALRFALQE